MDTFFVKAYEEKFREQWDHFIFESVNGTFLQSRNFLNYHEKGRFEDCSLMVFDAKGHLAAVVPACVVRTEEQKCFYSHKGSTYGGIIIGSKYYSVQKILHIIDCIEKYLLDLKFSSIRLKLTPDLFAYESGDVLQYCLYQKGYSDINELNLYVDLREDGYDIYKSMSQGKRTDVNNCKRAGMQYRDIKTEEELKEFYDILCSTLKKYNVKPVHSLQELIEFKNVRLPNICEFKAVYYEGKMVAGGMLFNFVDNCMHTQYLCATEEFNKLSPMTFLYYCILCEMKERDFHYVSWGITTEDNGKYINIGLTKSKEAYGSKYQINSTLYKNIGKKNESDER